MRCLFSLVVALGVALVPARAGYNGRICVSCDSFEVDANGAVTVERHSVAEGLHPSAEALVLAALDEQVLSHASRKNETDGDESSGGNRPTPITGRSAEARAASAPALQCSCEFQPVPDASEATGGKKNRRKKKKKSDGGNNANRNNGGEEKKGEGENTSGRFREKVEDDYVDGIDDNARPSTPARSSKSPRTENLMAYHPDQEQQHLFAEDDAEDRREARLTKEFAD